jgi:hypothetical protein
MLPLVPSLKLSVGLVDELRDVPELFAFGESLVELVHL